MRSTALPADMFHRSHMKHETTISASDYMKLLKAARDKQKMPEFYAWQRNRKIILKVKTLAR